MLNVLIDTSPLTNAHAGRGIGVYTRSLVRELEERPDLKLYHTSTSVPEDIKLDLVHYPFFDLFFTTLPWLKTSRCVVTIHDVIPLVFPQYYRPGKKGKISFFKQALSLRTVQHVITDSESSKHDITQYLRVAAEKISVIPLAPQPGLRHASTALVEKTRKKLRLPETYVLYVGDINYNKNIPQLIKMLKFLPDEVQLVCVGKEFYPHAIPEWNWIETQIALSDVSERVKFVNDVGRDAGNELSALYTGALSYVQPSLYEGFGLPVVEAMTCQTPVVASDTSSLPEVTGSHAVLVEPTASGLADGVRRIMELPKSRRIRFVKEAKAWSERFTWQRTAQKTVEVYEKVVQI